MYDFDTAEVFTEASLVDSVIYKSLNNNAELMRLILSAINDSIVIDSSYIQEQLLQIKRTKISPLAEDVLRAYEEGNIVLLYSKNKRVPQALPFFTTKSKGEIKVFIFVNNYGTITKSEVSSEDKFLNITMKDLYVLMEGAYASYKYAMYPAKVSKSLGLMKVCCNTYVAMVMRILNKEYAVGMDKDLYQKVAFVIGTFFLKSIWMSNNDDVNFSYACNSAKIGSEAINKTSLFAVADEYNAKGINSIDELLEFLKTLSPRFNGLNFRYFLQCYINTYKAGSMFGMECLPYFVYTIQATMIGSFLVNQPIIYDIIKNIKSMNTFYPELVKAIS